MNHTGQTNSVAGSGSEGFTRNRTSEGSAGILAAPKSVEYSLPDSHSGTTISELEGLVETAENDAICGKCHVRLGDHSHVDNACPSPYDRGPLFLLNQFFTPKFVSLVEPPIRVNGGDLR